MKIMIVDDNAEIRDVIKQLLGRSNVEFCECVNGTQAIEAFENFLPDWVLMDIQMQQTDGLTATREIKAAHPGAKILIVSNYNDSQFREEAKLLGTDGYILKENLLELRSMLFPGFQNGKN
jgi:CheY-like chemotaxis protein